MFDRILQKINAPDPLKPANTYEQDIALDNLLRALFEGCFTWQQLDEGEMTPNPKPSPIDEQAFDMTTRLFVTLQVQRILRNWPNDVEIGLETKQESEERLLAIKQLNPKFPRVKLSILNANLVKQFQDDAATILRSDKVSPKNKKSFYTRIAHWVDVIATEWEMKLVKVQAPKDFANEFENIALKDKAKFLAALKTQIEDAKWNKLGIQTKFWKRKPPTRITRLRKCYQGRAHLQLDAEAKDLEPSQISLFFSEVKAILKTEPNQFCFRKQVVIDFFSQKLTEMAEAECGMKLIETKQFPKIK